MLNCTRKKAEMKMLHEVIEKAAKLDSNLEKQNKVQNVRLVLVIF